MRKSIKNRGGFKKFCLFCFRAIVILALIVIISSLFVFLTTCGRVYSEEDYLKSSLKDDRYDAIIVLGCAAWGGGPSPMLADRLRTAVDLYKAGVAPKILMSGDHGQEDYNEVGVMRTYALDEGVPSEDIFMDHAGFSTYETMYRASAIFGIKKALIVTQKYHLFRSLFNAGAYGISCVGVDAGASNYIVNPKYYPREVLAMSKDFFFCIFRVKPTFLGDPIDIRGNGEVTLD
ncbi:MAG: YdcF family protein [Clostridiales bacterium]|nr:YdcF family protein [Clostridiales bacterium]